MIKVSPAEALGPYAHDVRALLVETIQPLHERFAEAHEISGSRYAMVFGSQWRDLLNDVKDAHKARGYTTHKLPPARYELPVVNDCLIYAWRTKDSAGSASSFASSPTRMNGFSAPLPHPTLFDPAPTSGLAPDQKSSDEAELEDALRTKGVMSLVLVMIHSSPRQLPSIEWAVAELDEETGKVSLHGRETIWGPELAVEDAATEGEPFDSGTPSGPMIEPREKQGINPDA